MSLSKYYRPMHPMHPMLSPDNRENSPEIAAKTALLLLAVGINALEYLLPRVPVLPWLKPGLANIVTIIWIIRWGAADAIFFSIVRSWITSFYFGFSLVSFVLSMSGGLVAAAGMGTLWLLFGRRGWLGLVGLGIAGAVLHNAGQLCGVYFLLTASMVIWYQFPFMLLASLVFGTVTGFFAHALLPMLTRGSPAPVDFNTAMTGKAPLRLIAGGALLAASIGIAIIRSPLVLGVSALLASLLAFGSSRWKFRAFLFPVSRFWLLFVFVGVMYLFFSYGRTAAGISFVTYEGIRETLLQWLKLWAWLEFSLVLSRLEFNRSVLTAAVRWIPFCRDTLIASLFALELFPPFIGLLRKHAALTIRTVRGRFVLSIEALYNDLEKLVCTNAIREDAVR